VSTSSTPQPILVEAILAHSATVKILATSREGLRVADELLWPVPSAQAESFWATMKIEFYDRYLWPIKAAAKRAVGDWIERIYKRRRRHSAIGMISRVDFEDRLTQTAQAA
jgi:predicted ATPase